MARVRDNTAENERRNFLSRLRGFVSRAEERKAIERGEYPSALERKENTEFAVRKIWERLELAKTPEHQEKVAKSKAKIAEPKETKPTEPVEFVTARPPKEGAKRGRTYQDEKSHQWSLAHSRQDNSKFSDRWGRKRKDLYYHAFVEQWRLPSDERDWDPLYDYLEEYWDFSPDHDSTEWAPYPKGK